MVRARKRFGQHFLEPAWVEKVVRAIDPRPDDTFIEIGPGHGALTRPLAARAKAVVAYEIDRDLVSRLRATMPPNVTIVEGDVLAQPDFLRISSPRSTAQPAALRADTLRVAGNLPYNVASPILFALVDRYLAGATLLEATLMLQREVADRLVAGPGRKGYGVLSVLIQHAATAERLFNLPPGAFRPSPKVHSSLVRLRFHPPDPPARDRQLFERVVQAVFTRRRKTLANALAALPTAVGSPAPAVPGWLDGRRRPETLSVAEFVRLADAVVSSQS